MLDELSDYIDGELDPSLCEEIDKHLQDCGCCKTFVETLRKSVETAHRLEKRSLPASERDRILKAFKETCLNPDD